MNAFAYQAQPNNQYDNEAAEKIKMIVHRTILERRKAIRDSYVGSQRKFLTEQILDDGIKQAVDEYLQQRMLANENECPPMTEEELEFLVQRCWESAQEYERLQAEERGYDEQLANFISNEEREMNEYYADLENSLQQDRENQEYYQSNDVQNQQYQQYQQANYDDDFI